MALVAEVAAGIEGGDRGCCIRPTDAIAEVLPVTRPNPAAAIEVDPLCPEGLCRSAAAELGVHAALVAALRGSGVGAKDSFSGYPCCGCAVERGISMKGSRSVVQRSGKSEA